MSLFSDAVKHPNGLVLSPDGSILYVAQIFTGLAPIGFADKLWAIPLEGGKPAGEPRLVARTGEGGGQADLVAGREALARLDSRAGAVLSTLTAAERSLLDAARLLFADGPRKVQESLFAERLALARMSLSHEAEISVFYGLALQGLARHGTVKRWRVESATVLEDVLAQYPRHPGALHYLVHAYDHPSLSQLAIRPGRSYEALLIRSGMDFHAHTATHTKHP